jgi:hypothetical protein
MKYTVTFSNRGRRAITLEKPIRSDQFWHLVLFLHDGTRWIERNPMGLRPDTDDSVVLHRGQELAVSGVLQHNLVPFGHYNRSPGNTSLKAVKCQLRVRYKDKFSPKGEVACSNTVDFTVKSLGMTELGSVRVDRDHYPLCTLMRADDTGDLFYYVKGLGTVRLGVLKNTTTFSFLADKQNDVHVLWKHGASRHEYAVFEKGIPDSVTLKTLRTEEARLRRTVDGRVRTVSE